MQAHAIYPNHVSPEDNSRPVSPLGSSSTDTELLSARASGHDSRSVPNTPSRANLTASFNAVQHPDEGPTLNTPAGSPKHGGARPMLPEDSTDQAGVSPAHTQGAPQQGDTPPQGASVAMTSGSPRGANAGHAKGTDSSSSMGSGAPRGMDVILIKGRASSSKGSSRKDRGSPSDVHASPARVRGSNSKGSNSKGSSRDSGNRGSSNKGSISSKASSSRDDGSKDNSGTALEGTVLSYKDKLLSAAASSSAASTKMHSPASSVSSAQSLAGQDQSGRSSRQGSKTSGQNSKSKGGASSSISAEDSTPQHEVTTRHGGTAQHEVTPQHKGTPQHGGGSHHGAELANTLTSHRAGCSPGSSLPHHSPKVAPTQHFVALMCQLTYPSILTSSCVQACTATLCTACRIVLLQVGVL